MLLTVPPTAAPATTPPTAAPPQLGPQLNGLLTDTHEGSLLRSSELSSTAAIGWSAFIESEKRQLRPVGAAKATHEETKETIMTGASIFSVYNSALRKENNDNERCTTSQMGGHAIE
jgi:hypothetical protein